MVNIKRRISNYNHSDNNNVEYIVCHDTGNYRDKAAGNANYFSEGDRQASAHFFVDENEIYQVVEEFKAAWHCGDGGNAYGIGNHNSIGIEMCNSGGYIAEATIQNTIWLIKQLQFKYGIDNEHVVRHYDASRKICPNNMSNNNWAKWWEFKKRLQGASGSSIDEDTDDYGLATVTTKSGLNVRSGAGTEYDRIGSIACGTEVRIGFVKENWANIYYGNHGGWVCIDYLNVYKLFKKNEQPKQNIMYRVILDGKQVEALSYQNNAEESVKIAVNSGKAKSGKVQTTDGVDVFKYPEETKEVIWYRIYVDGVKVEVDRDFENAKALLVRYIVKDKKGTTGYIERNNDGEKIFEYQK